MEAAEKTVSHSFLCLGFVVSQSVIVSRTACLFCRAECVVCVVVVCVNIIITIIIYKEYSMRYTHTIKRWWPLRVAQSTNGHITLHKRTG